ncbi:MULTISPECIES: glucan 1,4-alpha-glucosidase [Rhizobium]|uniref:glucan 1,4-alpha-glucosidase n=1 Tax=Rhizobium TaxID=379 RepID=UPI001FF0117B|nr:MULTISPECIES: glucan 1,4-alpha-glucosidase [Rhizobium]
MRPAIWAEDQQVAVPTVASGSIVPPGAPGIEPRWTSSDKSAVGTAVSPASCVWFTTSHGILNEIYAPRLDMACVRDFGFLVTADGYFSEEKRDADHSVQAIEDGVPAFRLVNTARDGRYRITKTVFADPDREVVLQDLHFEALVGSLSDYQLHALVAPHLVNGGADNTAWYGEFKGRPMLFAQGSGRSLAVASTAPWIARSAGYVGMSDGWQTLSRGQGLNQDYRLATSGNVALSGTLDMEAGSGRALVAIGFGTQPEEAAFRAVLSLDQGAVPALRRYRKGWREWQSTLFPLDEPHDPETLNRYRVSTGVLATHRDDTSGAIIASLSVPWGFNKSDDDLGGYHLVWTRDLVETAGGLLAAGAEADARSVLDYLLAIQEADGHWVQNAWLDGRPYWNGIQMDETAFPILLYDMLLRAGVIEASSNGRYLQMIEAAAAYIVRNGPATQQDRWEEDGGYSPFTLAVEIAGLLAAADALEAAGRMAQAQYLREVADGWNESIEEWTYASDTELSRRLGIAGYYVRIASDSDGCPSLGRDFIPIRNRDDSGEVIEADLLLSPDALALVRFGLRAADDPRIVDTVTAIDSELRRDLPTGSYWYRYNGDGYGERDDGRPFAGSGIGRLWPLLTGERAHYELAAGRSDEARRLLAALEASASDGGLIPEQVWDSADLPARELFLGRPSGSAMPLVWAHAEHIKLLRSIRDGVVFDMPPQTVARYIAGAPPSPPISWRPTAKRMRMPAGRVLRIELPEPALVHWSKDGWVTTADAETHDTGFGTQICDLRTDGITNGYIDFTLFWTELEEWEGTNYRVEII